MLDPRTKSDERNLRLAACESFSVVKVCMDDLLSLPSNFSRADFLFAFVGGGGNEICGGGGMTLGCKCFGRGNEVMAS